MTAPVSVSGGAASIAADCEDLFTLSGLIGSIAERLSGQAFALHVHLVDGLGPGAVLDPAGAASVEAAMLAAVDGPHGLATVIAEIEVVRLAVRTAAESYLAADDVRVYATPVGEALLHSATSQLSAVNDLLHGRWSVAGQDLLTENPYLVDMAVRAIPGSMPLPGPGTNSPASAAAGLLYPDGEPVLTPTGVQTNEPPPRSVRDVLNNLARTNEAPDGTVAVRMVRGIDSAGRAYRTAIVDIPGTKDWNLPGRDPDVANFGSDLHALAGQKTTYEKGVLAALDAAGVTADDDITLVGHSLGGVVAVNAARDLAASGRNISHVITAGAPISNLVGDLPSSVQVMAIENRPDIVPHLDGSANPDRGTVTTVTVDHDHHGIGANHDLERSYVPGAADIDASDDPSVQAYLGGLSDQLSGGTVTAYSYVVTRAT